MTNAAENDPVMQYIVMRTDLKFGTGAIAANASHASVAAIIQSLDSPGTREFLSDIPAMHTVVLRVESLAELLSIHQDIEQFSYLWVEQPENVPTALATFPCRKSELSGVLASLKLL